MWMEQDYPGEHAPGEQPDEMLVQRIAGEKGESQDFQPRFLPLAVNVLPRLARILTLVITAPTSSPARPRATAPTTIHLVEAAARIAQRRTNVQWMHVKHLEEIFCALRSCDRLLTEFAQSTARRC